MELIIAMLHHIAKKRTWAIHRFRNTPLETSGLYSVRTRYSKSLASTKYEVHKAAEF